MLFILWTIILYHNKKLLLIIFHTKEKGLVSSGGKTIENYVRGELTVAFVDFWGEGGHKIGIFFN